MTRISFTANLLRHLPCPPVAAKGSTLRAVLDDVFAGNPQLRSYVLDEQGRVRRHVKIYINDRPARDRLTLSDAVGPDDDIHVLQALSGG